MQGALLVEFYVGFWHMQGVIARVAIFDTTHLNDTTRHEVKRIWVCHKRVRLIYNTKKKRVKWIKPVQLV